MASAVGFQAARRFDFRVGYAQPGDCARVWQAARSVVDAARHELPLAGFGEDAQVRQQVLARGEIAEAQQLFVGEAGFDFGERAGFCAIEQEEAEEQQQRAAQHPDGFAAAPDDAAPEVRPTAVRRGRYFGCPAACYCHCESNLNSKLWRGATARQPVDLRGVQGSGERMRGVVTSAFKPYRVQAV